MITIHQTEAFAHWLQRLRDPRAKARLISRIERLATGNPGDARAVGEGVSELRIDYGPGYRIYFKQFGPVFVLLLCGGDKRTQQRDIAAAKSLARSWQE